MKHLLILVLLFTSQMLWAQENWINYTNNFNINDIEETAEGLWISSGGGVCFVDALTNEETYYNRGNSELPSNSVYSLVEHPNKDIWATTSLGICKISDGEITRGPENLRGSLALNPENKLVVANSDSLYLQTEDMNFEAIAYPAYFAGCGGIEFGSDGTIYINVINWYAATYVATYKNNEWEIIFTKDLYETNIAMDSEERLWFRSSIGMKYYENGAWVDEPALDTLKSLRVGSFSIDKNDHFIFSILDDECPYVLKWDGATLSKINFEKSDCSRIKFLEASSIDSNKFYASNVDFGMYSFSDVAVGEYQPYSQSPVSYNHIVATLHSADSKHYIIYHRKIDQLFGASWTEIALPNDFEGSIRFAYLREEKIWISNGSSIWFLVNEAWCQLELPNEITSKIEEMEIGANGDIWIQSGTNIARYKNDTWEIYGTTDHKIFSCIIKDMKVDPINGDLWVSSFSGVRHFDNTSWTRYDIPYNKHVFSLAIAPDRVFAETGEFFQIKDGVIDSLPSPPEGNNVTEMIFDAAKDKLYVSGYKFLGEYSDGDWVEYTTKNSGLYNNPSNDISIDKKGNLWLSGSGGGIGIFNSEEIILNATKNHVFQNTINAKIFPTLVSNGHINIQVDKTGDYELSTTDYSGRTIENKNLFLHAGQAVVHQLDYPTNAVIFISLSQGDQFVIEKVLTIK